MTRAAPRVLIFDVGGTVFDWSAPIAEGLSAALSRQTRGADELGVATYHCREAFLRINGAVLAGERPWMGAEEVFAEALRETLDRNGLAAGEADRVGLREAWRRMPAWPGAAQAISALRRRFVVAPLTILSLPMVVGSSRHSGIDWDCILSCDLLGVYKPDPRAYARAIEVMGVEPPEVMMVASHPSDLRAAHAVGWRTAYVRPRLHDPGEDYEDRGFDREFDFVVESFGELVERLLAY